MDLGLRDSWERSRLFSTSGIRGAEEQERRSTSALLSVVQAVPDFGHAVLSTLGAPKGKIETFTEVRLKDEAKVEHVPDGVILVSRGQKTWACLVEVKTGKARLREDQIARYLGLARQYEFDALLTVSNEIRVAADALPYPVDKRRVGKRTVRHWSWWRLFTEAILQERFRGISDPDQAYILREWIRYLDDDRSGASGFEDMGSEWNELRDAMRHETARPSDPNLQIIAARWEQFSEYLALQLTQELGVPVRQKFSNTISLGDRLSGRVSRLVKDGTLETTLVVPDAIGPITLEANLKSGRVITKVEVKAPKDGRAKTKVNWLLRQLKEAPVDLRLEARFPGTRATATELLPVCREEPAKLLLQDNPKSDPRGFLLALSRKMGRKRGKKNGSFISETQGQLVSFYREVVQDLSPPKQKAPKLAEERVGRDAVKKADEARESRIADQHVAQIAQLMEMGIFGHGR